MWTVIYVAATKAAAEHIKAILAGEGILVNLRPAGTQVQGRCQVEIMVPAAEAEEAHEILTDALRR